MKALTPQERLFVLEYIVDLDVNRAGLAAGFSPSVAKSKCYQWVSNGNAKPHVFAAIQEALEKRAKRVEITADKVLQALGAVAFTDLRDVADWGEREVDIGFDADGKRLSPEDIGDAAVVQTVRAPYLVAKPAQSLTELASAAISEVSMSRDGLRVKTHDKVAALEKLARHLGMFKDEVKVSGTVRFVIEGAPEAEGGG